MAIRKKQWKKALEYYEQQLKANERDYALWNLVGDLHASNKSSTQAIEAWRHALEGYVLEGLYESVLGIGRKMLRHAPEEEEINLQLAEAYLGLEYYADCLSTFRSYMKLAKHRSEPDMKALFKKILESEIRYPHLLDEVTALYEDSKLDNIELKKEIEAWAERMSAMQEAESAKSAADAGEMKEVSYEATSSSEGIKKSELGGDGLSMLSGVDGNWSGSSEGIQPSFETRSNFGEEPPSLESDFEMPSGSSGSDLPPGEGKDHYDLGMVYTEMSLWDAAIAEFENARRDPTYRYKASLGLATCFQNTNDLQRALRLLEAELKEAANNEAAAKELNFHLGEVHELLGNMEEALAHFERSGDHAGPRGTAEERVRILQGRLHSAGGGDDSDNLDLNSLDGQA